MPVFDFDRSFNELIKSEALPTKPDTPSVIPLSANFVVESAIASIFLLMAVLARMMMFKIRLHKLHNKYSYRNN